MGVRFVYLSQSGVLEGLRFLLTRVRRRGGIHHCSSHSLRRRRDVVWVGLWDYSGESLEWLDFELIHFLLFLLSHCGFLLIK